jgi:DNA-binding NarL/FixJ family response regulator
LGAGGRPSSAKAAAAGPSRSDRQARPVRKARAKPRALSAEERQLIRLIVNGYTNKDLARYLAVSESTIYRRMVRIRNKLGAANRFELVLTAVDEDF